MSKTKELDAALRQADECYTELGEHIALLRMKVQIVLTVV